VVLPKLLRKLQRQHISCDVLGCGTLHSWTSMSKFRPNMLPPSSGYKLKVEAARSSEKLVTTTKKPVKLISDNILEMWTMDEVQKPSDSERVVICFTVSCLLQGLVIM
jgi:hypothetical protein